MIAGQTKKPKRPWKRVLIGAKILLAAGLLVWVVSKAHLRDYVQTTAEAGGQSYATLETPLPQAKEADISIVEGMWWWETTRTIPRATCVPITPGGGDYQRPGMLTTLQGIHVSFFVLAILAFPASLLIISYRMWYLLAMQGVTISLWESIRLTFLGHFFNFVVPGSVGGDLVKAWYINQHAQHVGVVLVTIFVDRLMGLFEMVILAGVMVSLVLAVGAETFERMQKPLLAIGILAGAMGVAMALLLSRRLRRALHLQKLYQRSSIAHHFQAAGEATLVLRSNLRGLLWMVVVTFFAHVFFLGGIAMLGISLRVGVEWFQYFIFLPVIYILGAVPITPGGVGVIEGLYVDFFGPAAVSVSAVVALAMLARLVQMAWGLPGLLVVLRGARLPKPEDMQAQLEEAEEKELAQQDHEA